MILFQRRLLALALAMAFAIPALAQQRPNEIKPPFNLTWGTPSETLQRLLTGAKATVIRKRNVEGEREAWDVDGLVAQSGVKRTVFYFARGELVEVELQYQKDDWDETKYSDYMGQLRRVIEKRYGPGQQIIRKTEPEGDVMQTLVGYKWNINNTAIELFYYAAQNTPNVFRTLSVHYKGY